MGVIATLLLALRNKTYSRIFHDAKQSLVSESGLFVLVLIPVLFSLTWTGYGAEIDDSVRYYGLFPHDIGVHTSMVALLKASPGLPLSMSYGEGTLHYHWFYFVVPALLSDFLGIPMKNCTALILSNLVTASMFFILVSSICGYLLPDKKAWRVQCWSAAIVIFAPTVVYFYKTLVQFLSLGWFTYGLRNHLLLSLVNCMINVGNNTMALCMVLIVPLFIDEWNRSTQLRTLVVGCLFLALLPAYSITLVIPVGLAVFTWLLLGHIEHPFKVVMFAGVIGSLLLLIFHHIELLSGNPATIALAFDGGLFLQNSLLSYLPVISLSVLSLHYNRQLNLYWLVIPYCLLIPTFLYMEGSPTGGFDFSLKISSLFTVAMAPMVGLTVYHLQAEGFAWRLRHVLPVALIFLGMVNTLAYAGQFPLYRVFSPGERCTVVPSDYHAVLEHIRTSTPLDTVIIDPVSRRFQGISTTLMIGERRNYLPVTPLSYLALPQEISPEHLNAWQRWADSGFACGSHSQAFASTAGYLIAESQEVCPDHWSKLKAFGNYELYESVEHRGRALLHDQADKG